MDKKAKINQKGLRFIVLNIGLAILLGLAILTGLILWLQAYTQHGQEVEVADVVGLSTAEAEMLLQGQGLRMVVVDSTYSDKVPFGAIVDQDPKPHSHAKNGRAIYITINATTKRQVAMPNLQDLSYRQAETTLRGLGLRVDENYEYRPSTYRDLVLDVKSGGRSIRPGDKLPVGTKVKLVVGYGPGTEQVTVPDVLGMNLQEARFALLSKGLTIGAVQYDEEDHTQALVYRQTPAPGTRLTEGETVSLRLSANTDKVASPYAKDDQDEWF